MSDRGTLKQTTDDFDEDATAQAALDAEMARNAQLKARQAQKDAAHRQSQAKAVTGQGRPLSAYNSKADAEELVGRRNLVVLWRDYSSGLGNKDAFERHTEIPGGYREWNVQIRGTKRGAIINDDYQRALINALGAAFVPHGGGVYMKKYAIPAPVDGDVQRIQVALSAALPAGALGKLILSEREFTEDAPGLAALIAATQFQVFTTDSAGGYTMTLDVIGVTYDRVFSHPLAYENRDNEVGPQAGGATKPGYVAATQFKQAFLYAYLIVLSAGGAPSVEKITVKVIPKEVV